MSIASANYKKKEKYITKLFEFVYQTIGRKVEYEGKQGAIFGYTFLNYNQYKDDLANFNNAVWKVKFDNGMEAITLGNKLKLI